jgi:hypothetical protein
MSVFFPPPGWGGQAGVRPGGHGGRFPLPLCEGGGAAEAHVCGLLLAAGQLHRRAEGHREGETQCANYRLRGCKVTPRLCGLGLTLHFERASRRVVCAHPVEKA